jgi:hypothetical protein
VKSFGSAIVRLFLQVLDGFDLLPPTTHGRCSTCGIRLRGDETTCYRCFVLWLKG